MLVGTVKQPAIIAVLVTKLTGPPFLESDSLSDSTPEYLNALGGILNYISEDIVIGGGANRATVFNKEGVPSDRSLLSEFIPLINGFSNRPLDFSDGDGVIIVVYPIILVRSGLKLYTSYKRCAYSFINLKLYSDSVTGPIIVRPCYSNKVSDKYYYY